MTNQPKTMESHQSAAFWFQWVFANGIGFWLGVVGAGLVMLFYSWVVYPGDYDVYARGGHITRLYTDFDYFFDHFITGLMIGLFMIFLLKQPPKEL